MSVYSMKPLFTDREGYRSWIGAWKKTYHHITLLIRDKKRLTKEAQRSGDGGKAQKSLLLFSGDARKMLTLLGEAKARMHRITLMKKSLREQNNRFPLSLDSRVVDVHYNKGSNEFSFLPRWTVKTNGQSYYVEHIDARMGFSTRELEEGSTRGMLRFRHVRLTLTEDRVGLIEGK